MNPTDLVEFYEKELVLIKDATAKAYDKWGCPELMDNTQFEWNSKFKSKGADAQFVRSRLSNHKVSGRIRLSMAIWPEFSERERYETAVHEAAHVAAPYLHLRLLHPFQHYVLRDGPTPRFGHGMEWKKLMWKMGLEAKRCHSIDTFAAGISQRRKRRRFIYKCLCPAGCNVGPQIHSKMQKGWQERRCRRCGLQLGRYTEFQEVER